MDDRGTAVAPLAEFAHMTTSDAITNFTMAFQRMQTAWVFAAPSHAAQAMTFVAALQRECLKALTAGTSWAEVGEYYAAVIRRADRKADGFAGSPGMPEAPDPRWACDQAHEWVCLLRNRAEAARKSQIAKKERLEEMAEYRKETDKLLAEVQRKAQKQSPGGSPGKHARGGRGRSGSGQQQWWQQDWEQQEWKQKPKGKGKGKDGKGKGKDGGKGKTGQLSDADFAAKRAEKQEELNTKHGQKDGKNPCFFHHGTPGGCRFSADDCKQGFH